MVELEVKQAALSNVEEGKHTGTIHHIEERLEPYHYIDIFIQFIGEGDEYKDAPIVKYGVPAGISENSRLGKIIKALTGKLVVGQKIDVEKALVSKKVTFMTMNQETERGTFVRVVDDSIKPAK